MTEEVAFVGRVEKFPGANGWYHISVSTSLAELEEAESLEAKRAALRRYIDRYLSDDHVGNPRDGCPLAALGPEAPRSSTRISNALDEGSVEAVRILASTMDGRREAASALMATLLGTVVMARMAGSHQCRSASFWPAGGLL